MTSTTPPRTDIAYATPALRPVGFLPGYLIQLPLTLAAFAALFILLDFWVLSSREVFNDFRTSLPTLTEWLLTAAELVVYRFGWIPLVILAFLLPVPAARCASRAPTRRDSILAILIVLLLQLVAFLIVAVLIFILTTLPLMALIRSVSGAAPAGPR